MFHSLKKIFLTGKPAQQTDQLTRRFRLNQRQIILGVLTLLLICGLQVYRAEMAVGQRTTLYWGSTGSDVRLLQSKLSNWGYYKGGIDGVFGPDTARAVREFQQKNGLVTDGIVGPATWAALGYSTTIGTQTVSVSSKGVSQSDNVELLARAITGEARGESYIGQVAVAAVILNRVEDPRFPNTIAGVIYQPGAFTAVADGQINLQPTESSRRAAIDALNGWDPTYGSVYYYNPAKATSAWIWSRPRTLTIGKHVFAN